MNTKTLEPIDFILKDYDFALWDFSLWVRSFALFSAAMFRIGALEIPVIHARGMNFNEPELRRSKGSIWKNLFTMINCVNLSPPVADLRASMKSRERNLARHRRRFYWMQLVWIRFFQPWTGHAHFDVFMFNRQLSICLFIMNAQTKLSPSEIGRKL